MTPEEHLTVEEAAELVDVSRFTIRGWVARGHLRPVVPNAKPVLFRADEVTECAYERTSGRQRQRLADLARELRLLDE